MKMNKHYESIFKSELNTFLKLDRGEIIVPSPLSQVLSYSKCNQSELLHEFMLPNTEVMRTSKDILRYERSISTDKINMVITKSDGGSCGTGIKLWQDVNAVYNHFGDKKFDKFVIQPYIKSYSDIRVIIIGDYVEAYKRLGGYTFRNNISLGAKSESVELGSKVEHFCRLIMERGNFPYAHIDLMFLNEGNYYLTEISLRGGTKGSDKSLPELKKMKSDLLNKLKGGD